MRHAVACGKAVLSVKKKCAKNEFLALFSGDDSDESFPFGSGKNGKFSFKKSAAYRYLKVATFPALARQALLEDQSERLNLAKK